MTSPFAAEGHSAAEERIERCQSLARRSGNSGARVPGRAAAGVAARAAASVLLHRAARRGGFLRPGAVGVFREGRGGRRRRPDAPQRRDTGAASRWSARRRRSALASGLRAAPVLALGALAALAVSNPALEASKVDAGLLVDAGVAASRTSAASILAAQPGHFRLHDFSLVSAVVHLAPGSWTGQVLAVGPAWKSTSAVIEPCIATGGGGGGGGGVVSMAWRTTAP